MVHIVANRVRETSTTTGTGALTLAGAVTGAIAFSAAPGMAVGATLYYTAEAVDAGGALTGDWEMGLGTYSAASTLTRTTVLASSNAGALVSFAAGTKRVFITVPAEQAAWARERLTAARTYYVRTDGSDSNTGLANTAGGAFLTIQKAADVATGSIDAGTYQVTVQIADGTYTGVTLVKPMLGTLPLIFRGNNATPANVHVNVTGTAFSVDMAAAAITVLDMKISATTYCLNTNPAGIINFGNIVFGAAARHINSQNYGSVFAVGNYEIAGSAASHMYAGNALVQIVGRTVTLTGTPAFSSAYALAARTGLMIAFSNTYTGSATGARYNITGNSVIDVNGGAITLFPGNAAHATPTASGGQYI